MTAGAAYRSSMPIYRIYPTRDGHASGPPTDHELADDTAALLAALHLATVENGAEAWEGQRLIVMLPPMPSAKPSEPSDVS